MRRPVNTPLLLVGLTVVCAVVAAVMGRPVWAAVVGSGLVILYWAIEVTLRRRASAQQGLALGTAIGGVVVRVGAVVGLLLIVALAAPASFATTVTCFVVMFTVYTTLRLFAYPGTGAPAGGAKVP